MLLSRLSFVSVILVMAVVLSSGTANGIDVPVEIGINVKAITPLYIGQEALMEVSLFLKPPPSTIASPRSPFPITLVWGGCWYGGGLEILGDCITEGIFDPVEGFTMPFRVQVTSARVSANWLVFIEAGPETMSWIGIDDQGKTDADTEWPDIGKGWILVGEGGRNWKARDNVKSGRLFSYDELRDMSLERDSRLDQKIRDIENGKYRPEEETISTINTWFSGDFLGTSKSNKCSWAASDTILTEISDLKRLILAGISEFLAEETNTSNEAVAEFLCISVRNEWRSERHRNPEEAADEVIDFAQMNLPVLIDVYRGQFEDMNVHDIETDPSR